MRRSLLFAAVAVTVLTAGGGYYGLEVWPQDVFRDALDRGFASLGPGVKASYDGAHYNVTTRQATIAGLTFHVTGAGDPPVPIDVKVGTVEINAPNLDLSNAWASALASPASVARDATIPVADTINLRGISVHTGTTDFTQTSLTVDKPRFHPWPMLRPGLPSMAEAAAAMNAKTQPPSADAIAPMLRYESALFLATGYDLYRAEGLKFSGAAQDVNVTCEIGSMSGEADQGRFAKGDAAAIVFRGAAVGDVTIDRVVMGPMDLADAATRLASGEAMSAALMDHGNIGTIDYQGIHVATPNNGQFTAASLSFGPFAFGPGGLRSIALGFRDLVLAQKALPDPQMQEAFSQIGVDTLTVSFSYATDHDPVAKTIAVHDTNLKVNELGTLALSADLAGVGELANILTQARLVHGALRLDDASLIGRLLRAGAAMSGSEPDAFREQIMEMLRQQTGPPGQAAAPLDAAVKAVGMFLADPRSLTVELAPAKPVALMILAGAARLSPAAAATTAGLKVTANAPP